MPPALLKNKIVLLGTSTPGLRDQRTSPSGSVIPGVELHANIIDGILNHQLIGVAEFNPLLLLLFTLISACLLAVFLPVVSIYRALLMVLLILLLLLAGSVLLWQVYWLELPVAVPLANLLLIYWLDSLIAYRNQTNSRHHILNMFGQYVPQSVLNIMIKSPDNYSMQSKDADLTILFCDIRHFTRISRQLTAAQLALLLNNYFDSLSQSIINHQGTLDKYIGDAIMAFWGNPIYIENHPELAVQAALDMVQRIEDLNVFLRSQKLPAIEIGIGVNTGTARVGNMGSSHRRTYTVIGDNVNIAARLEKLSKHYPVTIVVSEAVVEACPGRVFRALDQVVLEGGEQLITVYTPVL